MMRKMLGLLLTGMLFFGVQSVEGKKNKIEERTVSSIEELLAIKDWDRLHVTLVAEEGAIWRAKETKDIEINKADDFVLDGGEHPPTIYGHQINVIKSKNGKINNVIARYGRVAQSYTIDPINEDTITFKDCEDVSVENCSFSWGSKGIASVVESQDIEFKSCIFAEPLTCELDDFRNYACFVDGSESVSFKKCLFAHCPRGTPLILARKKLGPDIKIDGCVVFGYSSQGTEFNDKGDNVGKMKLDVRKNLYIPRNEEASAIYVQRIGEKNSLKMNLIDNVQNGYPVVPHLEDDERVTVDLEGKGGSVPDLNDFLNVVGPSEKTVTEQRILNAVRDRVFLDLFFDEGYFPEFEMYRRTIYFQMDT